MTDRGTVQRFWTDTRTQLARMVIPCLILVLASNGSMCAYAQKADKTKAAQKNTDTDYPYQDRAWKAPPFEGGTAWFNTAGPVELSKLKGKVVLLDFWTYCCINCMHILPDLEKLEHEFPNELVVIGVHSAKFEGEKDSQNIREAIMRYGIKHPVVNDSDMVIWRNYRVQAWPTRALIDPEGTFIGRLSGEGRIEVFRAAIKEIIAHHEKKGTLDRTPLHFQLETYGTAKTPLRFPGKVAADPAAKRLYIADSSHHRVVIADLNSYQVLHVIGDGVAGYRDGRFEQARFNDPQGMAFDGDTLYVADTKNHSVRKLSLASKTVTTIAGTGEKGYERQRTGQARSIMIASPWALYKTGDRLFIAMAGSHQIWMMNLATDILGPFAGNGRENILDGRRADANFAQPSGLTSDGKWLYVADSEVSAVRKVGLDEDVVGRLVGEGLFEFGDIDDVGIRARLQHALGVAYHDGKVYVADTYNNKIKTIDTTTAETSTFLGDGKPGAGDDPPRFDEPGGIYVAQGKLYVADTSNHRIRMIDLATKKVQTLTIKGLAPPELKESDDTAVNAAATKAKPVVLKHGDRLRISASVAVPEGHKLNPLAPMSYKIEKVTPTGAKYTLSKGKIKPVAAAFNFEAADVDFAGASELQVSVVYFPCETGSEGVCRVKTQIWKVPVSFDSDAGAEQIELRP